MGGSGIDNDSESDVEALVMKNLSCEVETLREPQGQKHEYVPRSKQIKKAATPAPAHFTEIHGTDEVRKLRQSLTTFTKEHEEQIIKSVLIRPNRNPSLGQATRKKRTLQTRDIGNGSFTSTIMKAADFNGRVRHTKRGRSKLSEVERDPSRKSEGNEFDAIEYVESYRREVGRFGSQGLHKRDRKQYETAQLVSLGCRKPKNQKMPIGVLVKKREYQKTREERKKAMDLATGMLVRSKRR